MKKIMLLTFFAGMAMTLLFFPVNEVGSSEIPAIYDFPGSTVDFPKIDIHRLPTAPDDENDDEQENGNDDDDDGFDRLWDVSSLG